MHAHHLRPERLDACASLLGRALDEDPAYAHIFPDTATRTAQLTRFFRRYVGLHLPHGCTFVDVNETGDVRGTVTLRPPGGLRVSAPARLRTMAGFVLAHGARTLSRMRFIGDAYEALERETADGRPYFHVHMMAVRPELQGQGIGSALLDEVLTRVVPPSGPMIVLTTHQERNVHFYRRAGFNVRAERRVAPPGSASYAVWCMRRS